MHSTSDILNHSTCTSDILTHYISIMLIFIGMGKTRGSESFPLVGKPKVFIKIIFGEISFSVDIKWTLYRVYAKVTLLNILL